MFFNAAVVYVGDRAVDAANTIIAPGYTTLDLGFRYVSALFGQNMIFRVNAKNVTDERYWGSAESVGVFPGTPRTVYVSAQFEF